MEDLLTTIKSIKTHSEPPLVEVQADQARNDGFSKPAADLSQEISSEQVIQLLKSHPSSEELAIALAALDPYNTSRGVSQVDVRIPGPTTAHILQILTSTTVPDHWQLLNAKSKSGYVKYRAALLRCFSSIAGLGSLVAELRALVISSRSKDQTDKKTSTSTRVLDILSVLSALLEPRDFVRRIFADISAVYGNHTRQQAAWREFVSLVSAGRILSTAAEALAVAGQPNSTSELAWIGEGSRYSSWLGLNIASLAASLDASDTESWTSLALLTSRALSLGYPDHVVREIYCELVVEKSCSRHLGMLIDHLRPLEQVAILEAIFRDVQKSSFSEDLSEAVTKSDSAKSTIASVGALCNLLVADRPFLKEQLLNWLSKGQGGSIYTIGLRRAILSIFSESAETLKTLLSHALEEFGDRFSIKHLPVLVQDAQAQVILLVAGQLNRAHPQSVQAIGRTGLYLNAVSNRLAASSNKARFLGMIVGTGISHVIEKPENAMKFDLEEMQSDEALCYLSLTGVQDKVGSIESFQELRRGNTAKVSPTQDVPKPKKAKPSRIEPRSSKIITIEEIEDSADDADSEEDLLPYEKPDDDMEDEDEDPTLVQRNKPSAPVYIRDLITFLRDTENVDRHHLAITTAPSLIRRKAGFGTELAEQVEELALTLVSLQNDKSHPSFHELRLQSLIAIIVSQPLKMGRWFAAIFFDGDLSQTQRSATLTALGLSAREIAGNGEDDAKALNLPSLGDTSFPSKRLSPALEAVFKDSNQSPIAALTQEMAKTSLQPLAAEAADRMTGPSALKVRTFSSRMEVENKRKQRDAQRKKNVVKDLYNILAQGFFYPLQARFERMMLQFASSSAPSHNPFLVPHILTLFLQTLSLIFSTAGPHNPLLASFTHEILSLLISLHTAPIASEPTVTAALLGLFLAVVDVNIAFGSDGEERLVTEHATRVMELREWASEAFDRTPASRVKADPGTFADPQEQVRTLSAGVMVRLGEVIERYQGRLMGVNAGFKY
ncbi:Uncharacterized protein PECH_000905 [Penicillium ucsense]|uniref:Telomere length regulation protein conserved domain-containing protein n=1 Tax=Penicillium ucsense TaxID=2839758 RepID=A0A8J8W0R9_9EURO|nr:Uncharacterized protein PECM_000400 [Penicillium ucsense]KAF7733235.1 Uncharacterized protein PECH_000905 [Penicillium ucsense]